MLYYEMESMYNGYVIVNWNMERIKGSEFGYKRVCMSRKDRMVKIVKLAK